MHTYSVKFSYEDRANGPTHVEVKQEGSTIPVSVSKALRAFFKGLDRKQRFDMNKGLKIEALRVNTDKAGSEPEGSPEAHKTAEESESASSASA